MNGEQRDNPFGTGWGDPLPTGSAMPSGFPPFRRDFDNARDPYTARNALSVPEEALNNGNAYVRKNRAWVNGATLYIGEAPNDGKYYLRKSLGWSNIHGQPIPMLGVTDGSSATAGDIGELKVRRRRRHKRSPRARRYPLHRFRWGPATGIFGASLVIRATSPPRSTPSLPI